MYELPKCLEIGGIEYPIRTDFRDILNIISAFNDPNLEDKEKVFVCFYILFENFDSVPKEVYSEAFDKACDFISQSGQKKKDSIKTVDFEQDESMIIAAVNRVAGMEIRAQEYVHWWTFLSYFMEIGDCSYSTVLRIRAKKLRGKPLEKYEEEFYKANKEICNIKERLSEEEIAAKERLKAMLA